MTLPDTPQHWENLPDSQDRAGVDRYEPPESNSLDPVLVEGTPPSRDRVRRLLPFIAVGLVLAGGTSNFFSLPAAFGFLALVIGVGLLTTVRARGWQVPWVRATAEGITVSDTSGSVTTAEWQDVPEVTIRAGRWRPFPWVSVELTTGSGEQTVIKLGDTIDPMDIFAAIRGRAPASTTTTVVPMSVLTARNADF